MPVYPLRFERWTEERESTAWAWWHLAMTSVRRLKWGWALRWLRAIWFGYVLFFVALTWIVESRPFPGMGADTDLGNVFEFFTDVPTRIFAFLIFPPQTLFLLVITLFAGAGLMADDRRTGALFLYLSKPVTRVQYLAGRIGFLAGCIGTFSVLPALGLYLLALLMSDQPMAVLADAWIVPALLAEWVVLTVLFALPVLALSSLFERGRTAGVVYLVLWFFSDFAGGVIDVAAGALGLGTGWGTVTDLDRLVLATGQVLLQPMENPFVQAAEWFVRPGAAFAAVFAYAALSLAILWVRSKPQGGNR